MGKLDIENIKLKVNEAFESVQELQDDTFKLEGFKIVLTRLLDGTATKPLTNEVLEGLSDTDSGEGLNGEWASRIANRLNITSDEVARLYHLEDNNTLRLILDTKIVNKTSMAQAAKEVAVLITAGRQAAKFDTGSTDFKIIRSETNEYGLVNKKNFTAYLKQMKPRFIIEGKGKNQAMKVTAPGFEEASAIAIKYLSKGK